MGGRGQNPGLIDNDTGFPLIEKSYTKARTYCWKIKVKGDKITGNNYQNNIKRELGTVWTV